MFILEEFADGIIQVENRGSWDAQSWQDLREQITSILQTRSDAVYVLFNFTATIKLDEHAFAEFIAAPELGQAAMAIFVGRRAHLKLARDIIHQHPQREQIQIRLVPKLEDAFRFLLDKQTMEKAQVSLRIS